MKKILLAGVLIGIWVFCIPVMTLASVGVGIGTSQINVSEKLRAGGIYTLPSVTVYNTGTESTEYSMALTLNETQSQLKPVPAWFSFSPSKFLLSPGQAQTVVPSIHLPVRMPPGDYFGYLEAHPQETAQQGTAQVGVAAAARLSFSVEASSLFWAILYRLSSLYQRAEPWSLVSVIAIAVIVALAIINKFVNLRAAFKAFWIAAKRNKK
jgi:hypothetical protein